MRCIDARSMMSLCLDNAVARNQRMAVEHHLRECGDCSLHYSSLQRTQQLVGGLGRKPAPPDLALRLRVALSQEIAASKRPWWTKWSIRLEDALNVFMVPATAGVVTAVVVFGLLIGLMVPAAVEASNDVPTVLYTPPELASAPFGLSMDSVNADSLVVEAYVDSKGRLQGYHVVSAPDGVTDLPPDLKNMLIFTTFRPAKAFGQPTSSRAILSFAKVQVKG